MRCAASVPRAAAAAAASLSSQVRMTARIASSSLSGIGRRRRFGVAGDDEMHPHHRPLAECRLEARHLAAIGLGDQLADLDPVVGVEAVARQEHEGRDEAVELVAADEQAGARPLGQPHDAMRHGRQRRDVDLEQLVARKGLENIDQTLARMALRVEPARRHHPLDLAADQRDFARAPGIGGRGEQADHAQLAGELA